MFSPFAKYQTETFCFNVLSSPGLDSRGPHEDK